MKEHMRKKQHKSINPNNKEFDKFYIINYLVNILKINFLKKILFILNKGV